jgi:predicted phosphodiesterase
MNRAKSTVNSEPIAPLSHKTVSEAPTGCVTRRDFLRTSGCAVAGLYFGIHFSCADQTHRRTSLSFGVVADAHYANTPPRGIRYYAESSAKMAECVGLMNDRNVDFLIELGDFKDEKVPAQEQATLEYLETIEGIFGQFKGRRYHVLGNHDVDSISKEQFLARVRNTGIASDAKYYSFDVGDLHFVVLDANYKEDGSDYDHGNFDWRDTNVPKNELAWLTKDLASTSKPVIAFIHQQLDGTGDLTVRNAHQVRRILQEAKRVLAVFQGHNHAGYYSLIEGIHYYTLKAMVDGSGGENSAYAIVEVKADNSIVVTGYRKAMSKKMMRA